MRKGKIFEMVWSSLSLPILHTTTHTFSLFRIWSNNHTHTYTHIYAHCSSIRAALPRVSGVAGRLSSLSLSLSLSRRLPLSFFSASFRKVCLCVCACVLRAPMLRRAALSVRRLASTFHGPLPQGEHNNPLSLSLSDSLVPPFSHQLCLSC